MVEGYFTFLIEFLAPGDGVRLPDPSARRRPRRRGLDLMVREATQEATQATGSHLPDPSARRRVGGRFWALADGSSDDDEEDGSPTAGSPEAASPTPSDTICKALVVGYEEVVAGLIDAVVPIGDPARQGLRAEDRVEVLRRVVHRRTAPTAVRPWKGPIPKVRLPTLTLQDFIGPNSWTVVSRRKKRRPAAAPAPVIDRIETIRAARARRLISLLGQDGPDTAGCSVGSLGTGYSAQCRAGDVGLRGCSPGPVMVADGHAASDASLTRVRPRRAIPGFPVL